ncbi:unnamed protein product [Amoebophrya sp. A120]|nr:unnamed protein product [Amoebophrya sp. A120]|eukprot:GSA120T00018416001.1
MMDVLITLVNRTVDWYLNEKIVRAAVYRSTWQAEIVPRLGSFGMLPWVQPENYTFRLDFRYNEDRLCLIALFTYESHEEGENIIDVTWDQDYDGQPDVLTYGIPRSWETDPPNLGVMTVTYCCAPEFAIIKERLKMARDYGCWNTRENVEDDEAEIEWWISLEEVPGVVLDMGQYFLQNFDSLASAFRFLDRFQTQQITLQNVLEKLATLSVSKTLIEKVTPFFRFLDRGGEGTISWAEFKQLNDLWSEMFLGLEEFLFFLQFKITVEMKAEKRGFIIPEEFSSRPGTASSGRRPKSPKSVADGASLGDSETAGFPRHKTKKELIEEAQRSADIAARERRKKADNLTKNLLKTMIIGYPPKVESNTDKDSKHDAEVQATNSTGNLAAAQLPPLLYTASNFLDNDTFTLASLPEVWDWLDKDGGGSLSMEEFNAAVAKYHYHRQNTHMLYGFIDADGDEIEREEFLFGLKKMMQKARANAGLASGKNRKDPTVPKPPPVRKSKTMPALSGAAKETPKFETSSDEEEYSDHESDRSEPDEDAAKEGADQFPPPPGGPELSKTTNANAALLSAAINSS